MAAVTASEAPAKRYRLVALAIEFQVGLSAPG